MILHKLSAWLASLLCKTQILLSIESTGTVPAKGMWDTAIDMRARFQFKNPDWTLEWGQPGNVVGKLEFGNVFWGEKGHLVQEWEGGRKPACEENQASTAHLSE